MTMNHGQRCVVTGMGVINSLGHDVREFADALRAGKSGIDRLTRLPASELPVQIGAEIRDLQFDQALARYEALPDDLLKKAKRCARRSPFSVQGSVFAGLEAWAEAELHNKPVSGERIGIIVAGSNLTQSYSYTLNERYREAPEYLQPSYALHYLDTDQVGTLSEIFGIHGEGFTVGGASASGNVGLIKGAQLISLGLVDVCLVVGSMADLSPMEFQGFYSIGAMGGRKFADQPDKACRPFDAEHEGFIYGQGSGCVVLESLDSAQRRGAAVIAEFLGGSMNLDGNRLSDPTEKGEARAMEGALREAGLTAADIDCINAHGSSSPLGDDTEIQAIRRVFGERVSEVWINATKGLTGHCLYSAGIIEAIASMIQMREGFVHPNLNLDRPNDAECRFSGSAAVEAELNVIMSNSFGFGGINTSIILKRGVQS